MAVEKMMVLAWVGHGVWKANCPVCGTENLIKDDQMVCARCNPGILANMQTPRGLSGRKLAASLLFGRPLRGVGFATVADLGKRAEARRRAVVYTAAYAEPKDEVMRLLRPRPRAAMNWYPPGAHAKYCDETLEALKMENDAHGLVAI